jgi:hypothetical protein
MMRRMRVRALLLLLLLSFTALGAQTQVPGGPGLVVEAMASPAGSSSAQPQLTVSPRGILLSWIESAPPRATLKFSEWIDGRWSEPRTVASGTDWFVNWADVPSVLRLADGTIVGHWLQKSGADTYAYDVRLSYSRDDGRTWSPSFTPHTDGTKTEHGFASLFQMPGEGLGLVWLDGRSMKPEAEHDSRTSGADQGAMSVRFASFDRHWKQTADRAIDLRVCECCPTTAAVTADGPIAAFRNRSNDEIRDIYVARFEKGGWSEPAPVFNDAWKIEACPVNGPMLSARGRDTAIAWFTATGDQGRTFVAFSRDSGRTFGAPVRLDDRGSLGRVDLELTSDGSALASWIEFADQRSDFRVRRINRSGTRSAPITVAAIAGSRASGYPRMAAAGDDVVFAWTETANGRSQVQTARMRQAAETKR